MDVNYINPFITAVKNVFETMIDLPFKLGKPAIKKKDISPYEVSGIIGISGEVTGCVVINFPEKIALKLASALLDEELKEVNGDCTDAIGEISNMIAGNAKNDFPKTNTSVSVPTVVVGNHRIAYPSGIPIISIPCETGNGRFAIDVALKES
jgi:chemotaxis protein CheX